jgi:hypothetical protein
VSAYVRSSEIVERLKLDLPVEVTLPDPWTGEPFTVKRENYLAILCIDSHNLLFEGQPIPPLYAEAGRAARAAQYQAELAEIQYRKWKAQRSAELREKAPEKKTASGKPAAKQGPTVQQIENFYRTHEDYEKMASASKRFEALAGLFQDIRNAFSFKSKLQHDQTILTGAYEGVVRKDDQLDRLREIEALEADAELVTSASGSAEAAAEYVAKQNSGKQPRNLS